MATPPPPPPPEDPFSSGDSDPFAGGEDSGIAQSAPMVAAKPGRMMVVLGFVGVVLALLFYLVFHSKEEKKADETPKVITAPKPIEPPSLPSVPTNAQIPPPAFMPPSIPEPVKVPTLKPEDDGAEQKARLARLHSGIIVAGGNGGGLGSVLGGGDASTTPANNDPNSAFAAATIKANSKAEQVEATHIGDLRRTIAQGRLIQATTESAINAELPAPIRAIVSRDTYGESCTVPLIPKGSRLIGSYNTTVGSGQSRVFIVWTRVIRPDGVDVMINSPGVDQIGQAGLGGQVDSKFQEIFSRSILSSVVGIGFAIGSDKLSGGSTTTTSGSNGSSTTGDAATTATVNALNRLGSTTDGFLQKLIGVSPSILVDQGTPINVFVNRDLIFPSELVGARVVE